MHGFEELRGHKKLHCEELETCAPSTSFGENSNDFTNDIRSKIFFGLIYLNSRGTCNKEEERIMIKSKITIKN